MATYKKKSAKVQPVIKVRSGYCDVAVWENQQEKDGSKFTTYSATVQKNYKDGDEWKQSNNFSEIDMLQVAEALQTAYRELQEHKQSE